ncbi:Mitochondrial translocator assembly and maintenance protein 41 [Phlyctochytrium bullatum]|nr:Mitochondrial translocator assembly and maintenance protein 41 [Phlyctochytrium bullatum]
MLLDSFNAPVRFAAGYGSGVFRQASYDGKAKPMIDLIFGVTHPEHWHSLNIRQNPSHYSFLKSFGTNAVALLQDKVGAGVYFNPDVVLNTKEGNVRVKYGVVSMDRLIKDLKEWETLYLAGRFQKPVKILRGDSRVKLANDSNLENSIRLALLRLPLEFTEEDFYKAIVSISYTGDFRMWLAENPRKVHNIVHGQIAELRTLYRPVIENCPNIVIPHTSPVDVLSGSLDATIRQEDDPKLRASLILSLPKKIRESLLHRLQQKTGMSSPNDIATAAATLADLPEITDRAIGDIVHLAL